MANSGITRGVSNMQVIRYKVEASAVERAILDYVDDVWPGCYNEGTVVNIAEDGCAFIETHYPIKEIDNDG